MDAKEASSECLELQQAIEASLATVDPVQLIQILHKIKDDGSKLRLLKAINPFHRLVQSMISDGGKTCRLAAKVVYALSLHGADINQTDQYGNIALLPYMQKMPTIDDDVLVAFMRCGADLCHKNRVGHDVLQFVLASDLNKSVKHRVLEYMPGVWRAVDSDDVCTVRRLINQWCHIRVVQEGLSVLQLAYNKGTENIIRVVSGIGPSMDLAHAVLAGDCILVEQLLKSKCTFNIDLKNMFECGATPVYYAMCDNNMPLVKLLVEHGARLDTTMTTLDQIEIPVYFAALSHRPYLHTDILRCTIPTKPVHVDSLYFVGKNVMFHSLDYSIDLGLFEEILSVCSATVLTHRIPGNLDARQYSEALERDAYTAIIDKIVRSWCTDPEKHKHRNILCLHGYKFMLPLTSGESDQSKDTTDATGKSEITTSQSESSCTDKYAQFFQLYQDYEVYKRDLRYAVENGDAASVRQMLYDESWHQRGLDVCHADSRCCYDGQPLLHKAILRRHTEVVIEIVQYVVHKCHLKLDSFRDQYFRTGLHYMYAMEDVKDLIDLLEDSGMSEYTMDMDGRSPLAFKDRRGLKEMEDLLLYHLKQDFSEEEPDPWSVSLPLPITGFLKKCLHDRHKHRHKHTHHRYDNTVDNHRSNKHLHHHSNTIDTVPSFNHQSLTESNAQNDQTSVQSLNPQQHYLNDISQNQNSQYGVLKGSISNVDGSKQLFREHRNQGRPMSPSESQWSYLSSRHRVYPENAYSDDQSNGQIGLTHSSTVLPRSNGKSYDFNTNRTASELTRSKSENNINLHEHRNENVNQKLLENSYSVEGDYHGYFDREKRDNSESERKGEYSDVSSYGSEYGEDYEGDQSDVDSEGSEDLETSQMNKHCVLL